MNDDLLRYDLMIETALRNVVRETLSSVAQNGLPGEHHFYITFLTDHPGVEIPDYLRKQYDEEMTIVLQYQFFGLKVDDEALGVTLSFNNVKERLRIPIEAITTFADPSVNFALQFQSARGEDTEEGQDAQSSRGSGARRGKGSGESAAQDIGGGPRARKDADKGKASKDRSDSSDAKESDKTSGEKRGEVISLDLFRKK